MMAQTKTSPIIFSESVRKTPLEYRILVIGNGIESRILVDHVREGGYEHVAIETEPLQSIETIRSFQPDMVLLDQQMPIARCILENIRLRPDFEGIAALIFNADGEDESGWYDAGALGFIPADATSQFIIQVLSSTLKISDRFGTR